MNNPIILDHDIGTNPDDFFALLMLLNAQGADLTLTISGNNYPKERARLAHKVISQSNKPNVIASIGEPNGHIDFFGSVYVDGYEPGLNSEYIQEIKTILDKHESVTYMCIQGLSNLSRFAKQYPEDVGRLHIIHMGLTTKGADDFIGGGTNMEADPLAAKHVYELGLPNFRVVGSHTTINDSIRVTPETRLYRKLQTSREENHKMLFDHLNEYHSRRDIWPALHDPLTVSVALEMDFVGFEEVGVEFSPDGKYRLGGKTIIKVSKTEIYKPGDFMDLVTELA